MRILLLASLIVTFCQVSFAADCLDKKLDAATNKAIREKGKELLDGKNKAIVPPGLPEEEFPLRKMKVAASFRDDVLVFFYFGNALENPGFLVPYDFNKKTGQLDPISVPDLGNGDSRLWDVKYKVVAKCGSPKLKLTYDACSACGAGNDMPGRFFYDLPQKKWLFFADQ